MPEGLVSYGSDDSDLEQEIKAATAAARKTLEKPQLDNGDEENEEGDGDDIDNIQIDPKDSFGLGKLSKAEQDQITNPKEDTLKVAAAPDVISTDIAMGGSQSSLIPAHGSKQINVNLPYEVMSLPAAGPANPSDMSKIGKTNTFTGQVEDQAMSDSDFQTQYRSFQVRGYAQNPSILNAPESSMTSAYVGNIQDNGEHKSSRAKQREMKRKRKSKGILGVFDEDQEDADNQNFVSKEYKGPWAGWEDENVGVPTGPDEEEIEVAERKSKKPVLEKSSRDVGFGEEKSILHAKSIYDYAGRSYVETPRDTDVDLEPEEPGLQQCYIPKRCIHTWSGHTKGISAMRLFPNTGHLILSGSMDTKIKLWDVYHEGKVLRTFMGHSQAVKDVSFSNDGRRFLSTGYDRQIKLWDTETGQCLKAFSNGKMANVIKFNPDQDKQNIFLAGMHDKKIIQYDINSGEITQEYDQHLGPVNTITFVDENRRFLTTSDDKTARAWDFDIPVVIKYIAEPTLHSMPAVTVHPNKKWLAMQSLDNQILVYASDSFRQNRKKRFAGHTVSGYACEVGFSPDGHFISSGDGSGNMHFWDFKTSKKMPQRLKAHSQVVISHAWLPHETSKLVTASWDGLIKLWD